jgi:hypothetical protein
MKDLHGCKNDVGLVLDRVECNRCDHDNQEVEDPVARSCQGIGRGTDTQRNL